MNRPCDSSARSRAAIAVIVGLRGNARAMLVPTWIREVFTAATAAWTKADRAVSATHALSKSAPSTSAESSPSLGREPPTITPSSTIREATRWHPTSGRGTRPRGDGYWRGSLELARRRSAITLSIFEAIEGVESTSRLNTHDAGPDAVGVQAARRFDSFD